MSNEFDIEAAKRGEPVEWKIATGKYISVDFIGMHGHDAIIYSRHGYLPTDVSELRMAPKKVKVRYRNYKLQDSIHVSVSVLVDGPAWGSPEELEKKSWFRGWIHTEWQEVEIPPSEFA